MNNAGFASVTVLGIIGVLVALFAVGGYSYYKMDQLHKENLSIKSLLDSHNQATTSTGTIASSTSATTTEISIENETDAANKSEFVSQDSDDQNYNVVVMAAIDQRVSYERQVVAYLSEMTGYYDKYLNRYQQTRNDTANSSAGDSEIGRVALNYYDSAIDFIIASRNAPVEGSRLLTDDINRHLAAKSDYANKKLNSQEALVEIEAISNWSSIDKIQNFSKTQFDSFQASMNSDEQKLEAAFNASASTMSVPYIAAPKPTAPAVKIPTITNTSCHIWGDTLSCDSYSF